MRRGLEAGDARDTVEQQERVGGSLLSRRRHAERTFEARMVVVGHALSGLEATRLAAFASFRIELPPAER